MNSIVRVCINVSSVFLVLSLLSVSLQGQIVGGSIVGVVMDPSGGVIAGARVEATNVGTNEKKETLTNAEGYYEFPFLSAGRYILSVEQPGFQRATSA